MRNLLTTLAVLLVLGGGAWYLLNQRNAAPNLTVSQPSASTETPTTETAPASQSAQGATKEFTVSGANFSFSPATLTVNKGDAVKITFMNQEGSHNFMLDEFNVKTEVVGAGKSTTVEFTADKAGSFEYYCGVDRHREMGMKGTLVVK